jgi:predicted TIM-barrel fold metal-dependent hydrolase
VSQISKQAGNVNKSPQVGCTINQPGFRKISRRNVLVGCTSLAVSAAIDPVQALANESSGPIDVHHHFFPPIAKELYGPFPPLQTYAPTKSLDAMREANVASAYLSLPTPLELAGEIGVSRAAAFAQEVNDFGKQMELDYPDRFRLFGYLPLPHIDASLNEISYLLDTLHAAGIGVLTNYGNDWIGEPKFDPVLEELNRRNAVAYVHPTDAPCCTGLLPNTIPQTVEWNTNTSRAIWSVINDGTDRPSATVPGESVATRYPNIRWIWSHAGGTLLGLIGRFLGEGSTRNVRPNDLDFASRDSKLYQLRRFHYDTAISANPIQMQALKSLVGIDRVVFGSDFPFLSLQDTVAALAECGLSEDELAAVNRRNLETLFQ